MNKNISLFEFGCEFFGQENYLKLDSNYIKKYYSDWKNTSYTIKHYKLLLNSRG